jgi:DNA-nicking Smr family endonuclease
MRRRRLRPDEAELWDRVIQTAAPLHPAAAERRETPLPEPVSNPPARTENIALPPLIRRSPDAPAVTLDLRPALSDRLASQRVDMDRRKFGKLKRGKLAPEGRIDLHGMTVAQAHSALTGFVLMSHQTGRRLVLVITGKGQGPAMSGVLRQQVPHWLTLPPLRGLVLQLAEAHHSHGGSGAIYVYLRRSRDG